MKPFILFSLILACALGTSGCVLRQPSMTHAHLGHCLTSWRDTPQNRGLLDVAREEIDVAMRESDAAIAPMLSPEEKARHIDNAIHALKPDAQPLGPGLDYGALRALEGVIEHLEYASTSEDASNNVVSSVAALSELGLSVVDRLRGAVRLASSVDARDTAALDRLALDLHSALHSAVRGVDANGNGRIDLVAAEAGLDQMQSELQAMLKRETNPPYRPLPKKYVLGLVRLPDGKWSFASLWQKVSRQQPTSTSESGY
jgi:hypothetical protein